MNVAAYHPRWLSLLTNLVNHHLLLVPPGWQLGPEQVEFVFRNDGAMQNN